jgi:hypothetical protein
MLIYTATRGGATPALNAMATVMALTTIVIATLGFVLYRLLARRDQFGDGPAIAVSREGAL